MANFVVTQRVSGMTCTSCETLIEAELVALPGVTKVRANSKAGTVKVVSHKPLDHRAVRKILIPHNYVWGGKSLWLTRDKAVWRDMAIGIAAVIVIGVLVTQSGLSSAIAGLSNSSMTGLLPPLVIGVAAGFSTCMATVGGLVLAITANDTATARPRTRRETIAVHATFNLSRIVAFVVLGALIGALGSMVALSGNALAVAMLLAAIVMGIIGIRLTNVSPRIAALSPTLPRWLSFSGDQASRTADSDSSGRTRAGTLGVLSFFVPCGFTQAMQVYALSTGSPTRAGLIMGAFALGTAPALASLAGVPLLANGARRARLLRFAGVATLAFALVNASTTLGIVGAQLPGSGAEPAAELSANVTIIDGVQVLTMAIVPSGYSPANSVVYADMPVRWEIDGELFTCASALTAPDLGVPQGTILPMGAISTFDFTLEQPGRVDFACAMGMYRGSVTAIEPPVANASR